MNKFLKYGLTLVIIFGIGFSIYFFVIKTDFASKNSDQNAQYACSMHPEIIRNKPGNCPICGMTLVKKVSEVVTRQDSSINNLLQPTDHFIVGNFQTTFAIDTTFTSEIILPGIVAYDPNSSVNIAARISGRIERMYVHYQYQKIVKGQKLFDLYSPELLTEQQNYIYLIINDKENSAIINASKQKLALYGMTDNQIDSLNISKKTNPNISIYSPVYGIVEGTENSNEGKKNSMSNPAIESDQLKIKEGSYIKKGEIVFKILNTDKVWGVFNIIQGYNNQIKIKQSIDITTELNENKSIKAHINFIETSLNPTEKSNRIRVYLNNASLKLPIGLRLQGMVKTTPVKSIWIQKQAMVSIGTRNIVFIKMKNGFMAKEIKTGIEMNDFIQIIEGISVQDSIAKNAQYLIDSESFITTE